MIQGFPIPFLVLYAGVFSQQKNGGKVGALHMLSHGINCDAPKQLCHGNVDVGVGVGVGVGRAAGGGWILEASAAVLVCHLVLIWCCLAFRHVLSLW